MPYLGLENLLDYLWLVTSCSLVFVQSTFSWSKHWEIRFLIVQYIVKHKLVMIKMNARVWELVKHHDCSIYFRYSITRAHTYVIMILCVPIATHGHLTIFYTNLPSATIIFRKISDKRGRGAPCGHTIGFSTIMCFKCYLYLWTNTTDAQNSTEKKWQSNTHAYAMQYKKGTSSFLSSLIQG